MPASTVPTMVETSKPELPGLSRPTAQSESSQPHTAKPSEPGKSTQKLSNAELKKHAKAEKAARRAKAVQQKQGGDSAPVAGSVRDPTPG